MVTLYFALFQRWINLFIIQILWNGIQNSVLCRVAAPLVLLGVNVAFHFYARLGAQKTDRERRKPKKKNFASCLHEFY